MLRFFLTLLFLSVFAAHSATLDSSQVFVVDSVEFQILDAFDSAVVHSPFDSKVYDIGNMLHIETRESVVRQLLLFQAGDSVTLYQLIESERLLRSQKYLSDARIDYRQSPTGQHIVRVVTQDNWTTTIPVSLSKPGDEWVWQVGLLENNFLGLGQSIGFFLSHDESRDQKFFHYRNGHFGVPNHRLDMIWSENSDGYLRSFSMDFPFLSRTKNQWAYSIQGMVSKRDQVYYWSENPVPGVTSLDTSLPQYSGLNIPSHDGSRSNPVVQAMGLREDSLSLRLSRSFGNGLKTYVRTSWDWHRQGHGGYQVGRYAYAQGGGVWAVDSSYADTAWIPQLGDSRLGLALTFSRIRYDRLVNFRHVKWTEDVDRGYTVQIQAARNFQALGALDSRWKLGYDLYLALGGITHHLSLRSRADWYLRDGRREDHYSYVRGEYIFKPAVAWSTVVDGLMDTWQNAPYGHQVTLGGAEGMPGFSTALLAGQSRFLFRLEQRYFTGWEIGTVVPVLAVFASAGQVQPHVNDFDPHSMQYVVGLGMRVAMSKSVDGVVNHFNISWPINGPLRDGYSPRVSLLGLLSL